MNKTSTICEFVDEIIDDYVITKRKNKVNFFKYFESENIDRKTINDFLDNHIQKITDQIKEIDGALSGDKILTEAYSVYRKPELREFKTLLERFIEDALKYKESKKITRKRKPKKPEQLVRGLHLIDTPVTIGDEKYTPVSKIELINSKAAFFVNVKTNDLLFLTGKKLSCSGARITNIDLDESGIKKIKNVSETMELILSSTKYNCVKNFIELPNKKRPSPKTVSPNYFLLKVIK